MYELIIFKLIVNLTTAFFQSSGPGSEVIVDQSCKRSSDILSENISLPTIIELRIISEKLYSSDLVEEFGRKFGLSSSNVKELRETLCDIEKKSAIFGKISVI